MEWKRGVSYRAPHQTDLSGKEASAPPLHAQAYYSPGPCQSGFVGPSVTRMIISLAMKPGSLAAGTDLGRARLSVCWSLDSTLEKEHLRDQE